MQPLSVPLPTDPNLQNLITSGCKVLDAAPGSATYVCNNVCQDIFGNTAAGRAATQGIPCSAICGGPVCTSNFSNLYNFAWGQDNTTGCFNNPRAAGCNYGGGTTEVYEMIALPASLSAWPTATAAQYLQSWIAQPPNPPSPSPPAPTPPSSY